MALRIFEPLEHIAKVITSKVPEGVGNERGSAAHLGPVVYRALQLFAPALGNLRRAQGTEQLVRQRKEHLHTTHPQERIDYQERIDNLQWKIDELQRQLDQQIRNHHELCTTMSSVLKRLQALDRLEDTTQARPYEDEGDIPF